MNNHNIIILLLVIIVFILIFSSSYSETFAAEGIDTEALNNLASMYKDGVLKVSSIETTGNITANGNITSDGDIVSNKDLSVKGSLNADNNVNAKYFKLAGGEISHDDAKGDGCIYRSGRQVFIGHDDNIYLRNNNNGEQVHFVGSRMNPGLKLIRKHVGDNSTTNLNYSSNDWVMGIVGKNLDWSGDNPGRMEAYVYVKDGKWHLRSEIESENDKGEYFILAIPRSMFEHIDSTEALNWNK